MGTYLYGVVVGGNVGRLPVVAAAHAGGMAIKSGTSTCYVLHATLCSMYMRILKLHGLVDFSCCGLVCDLFFFLLNALKLDSSTDLD